MQFCNWVYFWVPLNKNTSFIVGNFVGICWKSVHNLIWIRTDISTASQYRPHRPLMFHVAMLRFKISVFSVTDSFFKFSPCFQTGPFSLRSPPLTTYNQQLWLIAQMQAEHSNSKRAKMSHKQLRTLLLYNTLHFCCMFVGVFFFVFFSSVLCFLLFLSVGDFKQQFEISVELKGVMQDASVIQINKAQPKSRMLHCASVSVKPQHGRLFHFSFCGRKCCHFRQVY